MFEVLLSSPFQERKRRAWGSEFVSDRLFPEKLGVLIRIERNWHVHVSPPPHASSLPRGGSEGERAKRIFRFELAGKSFMELTRRDKMHKNRNKTEVFKRNDSARRHFLISIKTCAIFFFSAWNYVAREKRFLSFILTPSPFSSSSKTGRGKWSEEKRRKDQRNEVGGGFSRCLAFARVQWSVQCDTDILFGIRREGIKVFQSCERDFFCGSSATTASAHSFVEVIFSLNFKNNGRWCGVCERRRRRRMLRRGGQEVAGGPGCRWR